MLIALYARLSHIWMYQTLMNKSTVGMYGLSPDWENPCTMMDALDTHALTFGATNFVLIFFEQFVQKFYPYMQFYNFQYLST